MNQEDQKKLDRLRSYCSLSVLLFASCISLLTYCTTKAKVEESKLRQEVPPAAASAKP
jgi:hypothetical protein